MANANIAMDKNLIGVPFMNGQPLQSHYFNMALHEITIEISSPLIKSLLYHLAKRNLPISLISPLLFLFGEVDKG